MLGDDEYRHRRDLACRDRDYDLDDLRRMLAGGDIDSPGKRVRTTRVQNELDAARRELNVRLCDAPSRRDRGARAGLEEVRLRARQGGPEGARPAPRPRERVVHD